MCCSMAIASSRVGAESFAPDAEIFDATDLIVAPGIHRSALPSARARPGNVRNHRNRHALGRARRIHRRLLHAEHATGERQRLRDSRNRGTRRRCRRVRVWPIGAASVGSKGEALAEIAAMKERRNRRRERRRQARRHRAPDAPGDGLLQLARAAGDRSLRRPVAFCRRRDARRAPIREAGPEGHSRAIGIDLRGTRRRSGRAHRRAPAHRAHVHATGSLEYVRSPKKGLRVTCEVTPHHFTLTDEDVRYDTQLQNESAAGLARGSRRADRRPADGSVDAIATDHAPHHPASKDVEFDRAPFGITGFETALALGLSELVHTGKMPLARLWNCFTTGPARVLGIERKIAVGRPPTSRFSRPITPGRTARRFPSKSRNTPFDGRTFRGAPWPQSSPAKSSIAAN
jgi:dihydroorotase